MALFISCWIEFLPVLGDLVKGLIEGSLDSAVSERFAFRREVQSHKDPARQLLAEPLLLREEDLVLI